MKKLIRLASVSMMLTAVGAFAPAQTSFVNSAPAVVYAQESPYAATTLQYIRDARSRMYDDPTIMFQGQTLRDYITNQGLTKEQYVNDIYYDTRVEADAQRRAEETAAHGQLNHTSDGETPPTYESAGTWGENLAWGMGIDGSFNGWIDSEIPDLKAANGFINAANGHLYHILNPSNKVFGYGEAGGHSYGNVSALALSTANTGNIDLPNGKISAEIEPVVEQVIETRTEEIPFETQYVDDPEMNIGEEQVVQAGVVGERTIQEEVTYTDSVETGRVVISEEVTVEPVAQIIHRGSQDPNQVESSQPETSQPESESAAPGQPETSQPESESAALGQPETSQPESDSAAPGQPETSQPTVTDQQSGAASESSSAESSGQQTVAPSESSSTESSSQVNVTSTAASESKQEEDRAQLPKTGESSNIVLYVIAVLLLIAGGVLVFSRRHKK